MNFAIEIRGTPIAKARPRFVRRGKFVGTYNPQETEEGRFLFEVQKQWRSKPLTEPITVECFFSMPIPKGTSKKKVIRMLEGKEKHTKRPDTSNLIKFVEDCLNGYVWRDDSQIFRIVGEKIYGENPKTIINIKEAEDDKNVC